MRRSFSRRTAFARFALPREHPYVLERTAGAPRGLRTGRVADRIFGGNSNWRGPVWFPLNYLLIESLQKFHHYLGDDFKVECPTGAGRC